MLLRASAFLLLFFVQGCSQTGKNPMPVEDDSNRFDAALYKHKSVSDKDLTGAWLAIANRNYQKVSQQGSLWLKETGVWQRRTLFYIQQIDANILEITGCANKAIDDRPMSVTINANKFRITTRPGGLGEPVYHFTIKNNTELEEQKEDFATGYFDLDKSIPKTPTVAYKISNSTNLNLGKLTASAKTPGHTLDKQEFDVNCFEEEQLSDVKIEAYTEQALVNKVSEKSYQWYLFSLSTERSPEAANKQTTYNLLFHFDGDKEYDTLKSKQDFSLFIWDHEDKRYFRSALHSKETGNGFVDSKVATSAASITVNTQGKSKQEDQSVDLQFDLDLKALPAKK